MTTHAHETWVPEWTFGDRLRKVRREKKVTQDQAAQALNVSPPQIAAWETGNNMPRDIVAIAKRCQLAWDVPAEWMLGLEVESSPTPEPDPGQSARGGSADTSALDALTRAKLDRRRRAGATERYLAPTGYAA